MEFKSLEDFVTKEDVRNFAVQWQNWVADKNLSIGELNEWSFYFERLGKKFDMTSELEDNAII